MGDYNDYLSLQGKLTGVYVWTIIAAVIAVLGGITLYFIFTNKEFSGKLKGFTKKLAEFLTFERGVLSPILKISYLVLTIFITLNSFGLIAVSFGSFLATLIIGNVALRIGYEMTLLIVDLARDVKEIKKELKRNR